jgi:hypothetical protein
MPIPRAERATFMHRRFAVRGVAHSARQWRTVHADGKERIIEYKAFRGSRAYIPDVLDQYVVTGPTFVQHQSADAVVVYWPRGHSTQLTGKERTAFLERFKPAGNIGWLDIGNVAFRCGQLLINNEPWEMSPTQHRLLEHFARGLNRIAISRREFAAVMQCHVNTVSYDVKALRTALVEAEADLVISNARGGGYRGFERNATRRLANGPLAVDLDHCKVLWHTEERLATQTALVDLVALLVDGGPMPIESMGVALGIPQKDAEPRIRALADALTGEIGDVNVAFKPIEALRLPQGFPASVTVGKCPPGLISELDASAFLLVPLAELEARFGVIGEGNLPADVARVTVPAAQLMLRTS